MSTCFTTPGLLSLAQAQQRIQHYLTPISDCQTLPLSHALGRVLAEPVKARWALPSHANSAMDGYAFASTDGAPGQPVQLRIAGHAWAGRPYQGSLQPGDCVRIFTGALLPKGLDTVVMQEQVTVSGEIIHIPPHWQAQDHVRQAGEDIVAGANLLPAGRRLSAADLALLAAAGISTVSVVRALRLALLATGDELLPVGATPQPGQIINSNSLYLQAALQQPHLEVNDLGIQKDDKQMLRRQVEQAAENCDVLITSGGASVGEADYLHSVFSALGEIGFWKLALKPGKPMLVAQLGHCLGFGLPGNPVSLAVTLRLLVQPALAVLSGQAWPEPFYVHAVCDQPYHKKPGREEYLRAVLSQPEPGRFQVRLAGAQGSHRLKPLSQANALIHLSRDSTGITPGATVAVLIDELSTHS
ncbi:MAG: molybdopterin molybdotransferase MoeA [Methylococcales bacterium]|nr:molybdopterin molybdotransferase MoeA [Methylococcales bacterium]